MRNLIGDAPWRVCEIIPINAYRRYAGALISPHKRINPYDVTFYGSVWGADNGCFTKYVPDNIIKMLHRLTGTPGCKFVAVPDWFDRESLSGDAYLTLLMFQSWISTFQRLQLPAAFVLQDGFHLHRVPFDSVDALFIGGSNEFKYSVEVKEAVTAAKRMGKWVHMGRVNGVKRIRYARKLGCDSFDGTSYAIYRTKTLQHLPYCID